LTTQARAAAPIQGVDAMQHQTPESLDLAAMVADLNNLLRLKTTVAGIKMFRPRRGDGGDPENPPAERDPHRRPDRQHGLPARLDRRHQPAATSSARSAAP